MPDNEAVSITETMYQHLNKRRDELAAELVGLQRDLDGLAHDEKDPLGNSGLQAAQKDIAWIEGKISELDEVLSTAVVVTDDSDYCLTVTIGKRVVLHMSEDPNDADVYDEIEVVIDGVKGFIDDDNEVITPESPVGAAILGAVEREERKFVSPRGKETKITIVSITSR